MQDQLTERKIPVWLWMVIAVSTVIFVGFFLTFASVVTSGGVD